jgi:hypothetical protein
MDKVWYCVIERYPATGYENNNLLQFFALITTSRDSSGSIVSDYGLDDQAIEVRLPVETKGFFPLAFVSRPDLGPTQPSVQWVPGVLSRG